MDKTHPIPSGFTWNHNADAYTSADGRVWDPTTNSIVAVVPVPPALAVGRAVTPAQIEASIKDVEYVVRGTHTTAYVTMQNGYQLVGTSACADPAMFNANKGRELALADA